MNNNITAEEIICAIEREEITEEIQKEISKADEFLKNNSEEKPKFLHEFFDKTKNSLISTVNSCIKSRNSPRKKDDLKKYKEGYFNEIIQNANDVVWKSNIQNPNITISLSKKGDEYSVECTYPDNGFTLQDIYGFCTRGNSNKSSENGQEGMYGIGIKSLFCFCNYFRIENNIKIELVSRSKLLDTISIEPVDNKTNQVTTLIFKFIYNSTDKNANKYAGFNVNKLAFLIDDFIANEDINKYFYSQEEENIVFDVRSLMFTELRPSRTCENSIKDIKLKSGNREEIFKVEEQIYIDKHIKVSSLCNDLKYFVFHYEDSINQEQSVSIAYPLFDNKINMNDRIYATYFVANSYRPLLEESIGCLVNTKAINSSRSGLERESEKDPQILATIKKKGKQTITDLISILNDDSSSQYFKKEASNLLCILLYIYKNHSINKNEEIVPGGIFEEKQNDLRAIFQSCKLFLLEDKNYILYNLEDDEIDFVDGAIRKNRPMNSTDDDCRRLFMTYNNIFKREDTIYYKNEEDGYNNLSDGTKLLCKYMLEESDEGSWLKSICLPFIKGTKELIKLRIGGDDFNKIMHFMNNKEENIRNNIKKLVARYEINNSFDFMGNYSNNNIINWLFDVEQSYVDKEFDIACIEYEESYRDLKGLLKGHIYTTQYYYYDGNLPNVSADYWYKGYADDSWFGVEINEDHIRQFLSLLSKGVIKIGYNKDYVQNQFVHNYYKNNLCLRNRDRTTSSWDGSFKYFTIEFLNMIVLSFDSFKLFREMIDKYNKSIDDKFKIKYLRKCRLEKVDLPMLSEVFKWISTYSEEVYIDINGLQDIDTQTSNMVKFTQLFLGDVKIRLEKLNIKNKGAEFIGYISNISSDSYVIKIKKYSKDKFKQISLLDNKNSFNEPKTLVIFYTHNEQEALEEVLIELGKHARELPAYIKHFINSDNMKQLSSNDYEKYLKREDINYKYEFEEEGIESMLVDTKNLEMEDIYEILSAKYSYDEHCPICNSIPTLNIRGEEKVSANKNCLVIILPVKYYDKIIYVKTICCKTCFEEYKVSLTSAEIKDGDNGIKLLILRSTINTSSRTYDFVRKIKLSPDNWKIIAEFNELEEIKNSI